MKKILQELNEVEFIVKDQKYSAEWLKQKYIVENKSVKEVCAELQCSKTVLCKILKYYSLKKTLEQIEELSASATIEKYGVKCCFLNTGIKEKIKQTNIKKYGVENYMQTEEFRDESQKSMQEKYGVDYAGQSRELRQRMQKTCLERYGVEYATKLDFIKKKIQDTCLERYGVEYYLQTEEFKTQQKITNLEKYGCENPMQNPKIREKAVQSLKNNYGVLNPMQSKEILEKHKQNNIIKYGVDDPQKLRNPHLNQWEKDEDFIHFLSSVENNLYTLYQLSQYFNVDYSTIEKRVNKLGVKNLVKITEFRSHYEDDIIDFLKNIGVDKIIQNDKEILDGQEIDIYLPDYQIGIEFNGDYWHCDLQPKMQDHQGRSLYHQKKSLKAEEKNIFLFHIFEYEWNNPVAQENIKNRLRTILSKNSIKIPARKCRVIELTKKQKKDFLDINHMQGNDHSTKQYGLLFNKEIISCMTFVKPKNAKYSWELSRFCNKHGYTVQGGASKLFKYFVDQLNVGEQISSYNDITKTKGDLYRILGFKCVSINKPNYVWINFETKDIRTRYQEQSAGEVERMHNSNYHRLCDCGTKTWVYTKK